VRTAVESIVRDGERVVGGFGAGGSVDTRLLDILLILIEVEIEAQISYPLTIPRSFLNLRRINRGANVNYSGDMVVECLLFQVHSYSH